MIRIVFMLPILLIASGCIAEQARKESEFALWGRETLEAIERDHRFDNKAGYCEDQDKKSVAFTWSNSMLLLAFAKAAEFDRAYEERLEGLMSHIDRYWVSYNGIGGYDCLPHPKAKADRYYDDNAWIAMGQIDAYQAVGKKKYLEGAEKTIAFCLSGIDEENGGVWWRENWPGQSQKSKNTCSVAPIAFSCLRYYEITRERKYLETAVGLLGWLDEHLKDADHLYFDNLKMSGQIGRRKWSYNSAMPLRCYALLYKLTGEQGYLDKAVEIAQAAKERWYEEASGAIKCESMFAFTLIEGWVELSNVTNDRRWKDMARSSLHYVHSNVKDSRGRYSKRWDDKNAAAITHWKLLYPASTGRAYWVLAK